MILLSNSYPIIASNIVIYINHDYFDRWKRSTIIKQLYMVFN